jgi:hypothetical protein
VPCLMADQAQKIALHTTSALPPTTKTSPRITIAVSYFSRPSFLLRWGLLYPVAIPPASRSPLIRVIGFDFSTEQKAVLLSKFACASAIAASLQKWELSLVVI